MTLKDEVELLRRIPLFANVEPSKLKLLAFTSRRLHFGADQELFRQGDPGDAAYVILTGTADIVVESQAGPVTVAHVEPNSIVGEIAILCDVARTATVRASSPVECLKIHKDDFLKLITDFPEMAIEIMRVLASRLSHTTQELTDSRARRSAG